MYYLNCFFIYSIFGYLIETLFALLMNINFKSGVFNIPMTPVYGIGSIIILFISNYLFKNLHMNRVYETFIMFVVVSIILSFIEALGGIFIEKVFKVIYWDYSKQKFHIGKYVSVAMTFAWGFLSIIFVYFIHPLLNKLILKIPKSITIIFIFIFVFGVVKSFFYKK